MNLVVEYLLWPVVVFLDAVCGVLGRVKTPKAAVYQKIARLALLASVTAFTMTLPLSLSGRLGIGIKPLLALGVVLLLVFVVFGKLADEEGEGRS